MELRRIHHVAIAHEPDGDLPSVLGGICGLQSDAPEQADGLIERMWPVGDAYIQTLEPDGDGMIRRSLDRRGPGLHHIAFSVGDLAATLAELRDRDVRLIDEAPRPGGGGALVAFVHPSAFGGVLVELRQDPDDALPG